MQLAIPPGKEGEARLFYVGALGFEEVAKAPELASRGGAWFRSGSVAIHLGVDAQFHPAKKAHPAFRCDDYDALVQSLLRHGIEVVHDENAFEGKAHCYVIDPFGNRLELIAD